jgi:hypothetical protein
MLEKAKVVPAQIADVGGRILMPLSNRVLIRAILVVSVVLIYGTPFISPMRSLPSVPF